MLPFAVVGVGGSAGGLEAFSDLFRAVPANPGMAFVVIQHLPPDGDNLLVDLLQKACKLPVLAITNGVEVKMNQVYVIQPGRTLRLEGGKLWLTERVETPGHQRPIDDFFRTLAQEQRERALAVVVSGMGSNGTEGALAIKSVGGICIAQDPATARFPSMPQSLIDGGVADVVARLEEIPAILARYAADPYAEAKVDAAAVDDQRALEQILELVRTTTRHDFSGYKKATVVRRIQRRMGLRQFARIGDYAGLLARTSGEVKLLADDLMIHVTGFFRDPLVWEALGREVIRPLLEERPNESPIRIWVSACSTGEEAYSMAILLLESAEALGKHFDFRIFATDTAERSLAHARSGVFAGGIESDLSAERLERFFQPEGVVYRVKKEVRSLVTFAPQNLLQDPPFSNLDLASCRNLLIYLEPVTQRRVLNIMHFGLRPGGTLVLGTSEAITGMDELFVPVDKRHKFYRRSGASQGVELTFGRLKGTSPEPVKGGPPSGPVSKPDIQGLARKTLLERFTPAAVVVDKESQIVYFHGETGRFLEAERGEPTRDLMVLLPSSVRTPVRDALREVGEAGGFVAVKGLDEGGSWIEVSVSPVGPLSGPSLLLVTFAFTGAPASAGPGADVAGSTVEVLQNELRRARADLDTAGQEHQLNAELLKTSNEEIMSINEELQSTNEELETGKEELQSLNEELATSNHQLQAKMEELESTSNDLSSLLRSTDLAVIFLDLSLCIRRFTPLVRELVDVIPSDIGRKISDLALKFEDPDFFVDAADVIERLQPVEREIDGRGDRSFMRRILPYRTDANRIEGIVIIFIDITARKRTEAALRRSEELYRIVLDGLSEHAIVVLDPEGHCMTWPASAERLFGYAASEMIGQPVYLLHSQVPDVEGEVRRKLNLALERGTASAEHWYQRKDQIIFWGSGTVSPLKDAEGKLLGFVKVLRDYTERKRTEQALEGAKQTAEAANAAKDEFLANVSHELRTPLASILLWTALIEDQTSRRDDRLVEEAVAAMKKSAEEQKTLIEDLIDSARIEAGKMRLELKRTDLGVLIASAIETIRPTAEAKGVPIGVTLDPSLGEVMIDPIRGHQMLWNLVGNAVKFTGQGGSVSVRGLREGTGVMIEVKDNGAGIASDFLPQIFNRFGQAARGTRRSSSGLGLGLTITRHLVELHQGSISAQSGGLGQGSTFTVRLPLPRLSPVAVRASGGATVHRAPALSGRRVLLVEDDPNLRRALAVTLEAASAEVVAVESAARGLEEFERAAPDFIVSDIGMAHMDGYDFIRKVRSLEQQIGAPPVPALALTAFAGDQHRVKAIESGFQAWMAKPVEPMRILEALSQLMEGTPPSGMAT